MDLTVLLLILAILLVLSGLAGLVIPGLPGPPLLLAGLVVAAWAEDFVYVGGGTIAVLTILAVLAYAVDFIASALGAKRFGAGRRAVIGAVIGLLIGLFFGLPGILLGPFLGALIGELTAGRDLESAGRAGVGAWLGLVVGAVAKFAIAFSMIGIFVLVRFLSSAG